MADKSFLTLPFFQDRRRLLATGDWRQSHLPVVYADVDIVIARQALCGGQPCSG